MIETPRLRLRPWHEADKPAFAAIINTPAMMAHFGGVAPRARIDVLIDAQMAGQATDGFCMWAVDLRETGELAGICGLRRMPRPDTPVTGDLEIGWRIAEPFWGTGVAREAAQASLTWGWANTDLPRCVAYTVEANTRSSGLMLRLGMARRVELDFHHPHYAPDDPAGAMVVYAIDRPAMIETERLVLRPWREADRAPYLAHCNTPAVTRYLGGPVSDAAVDAALDRIAASQAADGFSFWAVERRTDGSLLGYCGLKRMDDLGPRLDGEVEIGWRLRENAWGQGYAREAAFACLDWAWAATDRSRIHAITTPGNARSWGLMERLGMTRVPDGDFDHPKLAAGDPLRRHLTYRIDRPA